MFSRLLRRRKKPKAAERPHPFQPRLEQLEDRTVPAFFDWTGANAGINNFMDPGSWSVVGVDGDGKPDGDDEVTLTAPQQGGSDPNLNVEVSVKALKADAAFVGHTFGLRWTINVLDTIDWRAGTILFGRGGIFAAKGDLVLKGGGFIRGGSFLGLNNDPAKGLFTFDKAGAILSFTHDSSTLGVNLKVINGKLRVSQYNANQALIVKNSAQITLDGANSKLWLTQDNAVDGDRTGGIWAFEVNSASTISAIGGAVVERFSADDDVNDITVELPVYLTGSTLNVLDGGLYVNVRNIAGYVTSVYADTGSVIDLGHGTKLKTNLHLWVHSAQILVGGTVDESATIEVAAGKEVSVWGPGSKVTIGSGPNQGYASLTVIGNLYLDKDSSLYLVVDMSEEVTWSSLHVQGDLDFGLNVKLHVTTYDDNGGGMTLPIITWTGACNGTFADTTWVGRIWHLEKRNGSKDFVLTDPPPPPPPGGGGV